MNIKVIAFGQIAEIAGKEFTVDVKDLNELKTTLIHQFPILAEKKYVIAVNQKLVNENYIFAIKDTIALMPPYSGG